MNCYTQGKPHRTITGFFSRNLPAQKDVGWYSQSAERKKTKNEKQKNTPDQEYHTGKNCPWKLELKTFLNKGKAHCC